MKAFLRALGLFAPLLVVAALAVAVVLAIFYAPVVLSALAIATGLFCVAALIAAVVVWRRPPAGQGPESTAPVRNAVSAVVTRPNDGRARRQLRKQLGSFDEIRAVGDRLLPRDRETLRRVLRELDAAERLQESADSGDRWERVMAARNLAWLSPTYVVPRLDALARDREPEVALAGARALAAIPDVSAYRALVRLLDTGPLPASRTASVLETSVYSDPVGVLEDEVPGGPPPVRFWGAYLAGGSEDPRAFDLLAALASDPDPNVRANAAEGLGPLPVQEKVDLLLRLSRDELWYVRAHAASALRHVGEAGVGRLTELLGDESWWVRENAANALAAIGEPAIPALRNALASEDRFARNKAGEVLVRLGFVEREIEAYLEGNGKRSEARESLVLLGRAEVLSSLAARFLSVESEQRVELARVLTEIDDSRLRPVLEALDVAPAIDDPRGGGGEPRPDEGAE